MKNLAYITTQKVTRREAKVLNKRKYIENLTHIDQMWKYLKNLYGDVLAVKDLRGKNKEEFSYKELDNLITKASNAFFNLGLRKGDVVTIISENSPRWLIVDQAIMRLGAIDAVRGSSAPSVELNYIIKHSKSVGLIVQSEDVWSKIQNKQALLEDLKFVIKFEDKVVDGILNWEQFLESGNSIDNESYNSEIKKSSIDDIATILYTSGTTGQPKGVPLTHSNLFHQIINLACIADPPAGSAVLSVLPIWHSYERSAEYFFFSCGCSQFYTVPKYLKDDIKNIKPIVMATVPRLWEAIYDGFFLALKKMSKSNQYLIKRLIRNSSIFKSNLRQFRGLETNDTNIVRKLKSLFLLIFCLPIHKLSSLILWPKLKKQLSGNRLKFPINGGGALPKHVDLFFEALGINVLVGYGLTETSPVLTCRRIWCNVRESSGQPLPFTEVKIVDEKNSIVKFREIGKIFVRGPQVMGGYLYDDSASLKVLSIDGWFDTGDLGYLIPNGSLIITGRSKDTIVLSSGENIEPIPLEIEILSSKFIDQVQLIGQDKKNLAALIVPNMELINSKFAVKNINEFNDNVEIRTFFKFEINNLLKNRIGARFEEQIIDCLFVDQFTIENALLTQTLKQKRKKIENFYIKEIEQMYKKQINQENIIC
tara:strand:- start:558 stop:2507 length:1950 start_codon:yes stop_codon:yes gene_type:complete